MRKFINKIECDLLFLCGKSIITDRKYMVLVLRGDTKWTD